MECSGVGGRGGNGVFTGHTGKGEEWSRVKVGTDITLRARTSRLEDESTGPSPISYTVPDSGLGVEGLGCMCPSDEHRVELPRVPDVSPLL